MRQSWAAALLLALAGTGCASNTREADSAAVYESLLHDHCCLDRAILQEVTDTTGLSPDPRRWSQEEEEMRGFLPEVRQAVDDLSRRSRIVRRLPDTLRVTARDQRIPADSMRALLQRIQRDNVARLPRREAIVLISAVGFSDDGSLAVVQMTEICGALCGGLTLRALRRHPGGWIPAEVVFHAVF